MVAAATLARCNPRSTPPPCCLALRRSKPTSTPRPVAYTSRQTHIACVPPLKHSAMLAATLRRHYTMITQCRLLTSRILTAPMYVSAPASHQPRQPHHCPTMPAPPALPCAWSCCPARQRTACVAAPAAVLYCMVGALVVMVAMVAVMAVPGNTSDIFSCCHQLPRFIDIDIDILTVFHVSHFPI